MEDNLLKNLTFEIGKPETTPFLNAIDIYQDGTVPFAQDDPAAKPRSAAAVFALLPETLRLALSGRQLQPILRAPC